MNPKTLCFHLHNSIIFIWNMFYLWLNLKKERLFIIIHFNILFHDLPLLMLSLTEYLCIVFNYDIFSNIWLRKLWTVFVPKLTNLFLSLGRFRVDTIHVPLSFLDFSTFFHHIHNIRSMHLKMWWPLARLYKGFWDCAINYQNFLSKHV